MIPEVEKGFLKRKPAIYVGELGTFFVEDTIFGHIEWNWKKASNFR
jgi:hypothetical protein